MKFNTGKVHPSPPSSTTNKENPVSSLNHLLPATILNLISVLSLEDREILTYMITRSLKSSTLIYSSSSYLQINPNKKSTKKSSPSTISHKSPSFDCDCFICYTTFWFRWDSSPHRELIHQAIEAFEEHLSSAEKTKINSMKEKASADVEERDSSGSHSPDNLIVVTEDDVEEREIQVTAGEEEERESGTQKQQINCLWNGLWRRMCRNFCFGLGHSDSVTRLRIKG